MANSTFGTTVCYHSFFLSTCPDFSPSWSFGIRSMTKQTSPKLFSLFKCCFLSVSLTFSIHVLVVGYIGMALSYALSLNVFLSFCVQNQCMLENSIVSVERLEQYMHIPSEAPEIIEGNRPSISWPQNGRIEIQDLKVKTLLN